MCFSDCECNQYHLYGCCKCFGKYQPNLSKSIHFFICIRGVSGNRSKLELVFWQLWGDFCRNWFSACRGTYGYHYLLCPRGGNL